jgi:starch synthase
MGDSLKILFLSPEVAPYAKTGGLADVAGSLPGALRKLGMDVMVGLPYYRTVRENGVATETVLPGLQVALNGSHLPCDVLNTQTDDGGRVFFIDREEFYDRSDLYATQKGDYPDNLQRFSYFNRAALLFAKETGFHFDVVHCHDWQTGLVPAFLRTRYAIDPFFSRVASVFTIHNMGYQGLFPPELLPVSGLPPSTFDPGGVEYWGNISLLKAGIQYADAITTVSPTYSREIQTSEFGMGMEGLLKGRSKDLHGILNGVDYGGWDPATDPHLGDHYSVETLKGKRKCKASLVRELHLDNKVLSRPLFAVVSRLTIQKGYDLLLEIMEEVVKFDAGIVILAAGEAQYQGPLDQLAQKYPSRIAVRIGFDESLAHRIMAGADMLLVPSRYEPCGLTQIYALRYGTVPIVRATGGLDDTIVQCDPRSGKGTGFKFAEFKAKAFLDQIAHAVEIFNDKDCWRTIVRNGMTADFSWEESAQKYVGLYKMITGRKG